jgi:hypothetical protein
VTSRGLRRKSVKVASAVVIGRSYQIYLRCQECDSESRPGRNELSGSGKRTVRSSLTSCQESLDRFPPSRSRRMHGPEGRRFTDFLVNPDKQCNERFQNLRKVPKWLHYAFQLLRPAPRAHLYGLYNQRRPTRRLVGSKHCSDRSGDTTARRIRRPRTTEGPMVPGSHAFPGFSGAG